MMKGLSRVYTAAAVVITSILLAFAGINLLLWGLYRVTAHNPVMAKYGSRLAEVYPNLTEPEIKGLLNETWSRRYQYEPFTEFKERPYAGRYVNVSASGFRLTKNQGPWPPEKQNF